MGSGTFATGNGRGKSLPFWLSRILYAALSDPCCTVNAVGSGVTIGCANWGPFVGSGCVFPFAGAVVGAARLARFVVFFADAFFAGAFFFRIVMGANMSLHLDVSGNNLASLSGVHRQIRRVERPMHSTSSQIVNRALPRRSSRAPDPNP